MGMDVYGAKPASPEGEYFRNNVWWWRPLWAYIVENTNGTLTAHDAEMGCSNDGHLISRAKAISIANRLEALVASGETAKWAADYKASLDSLPDEVCDLCHGTGTRTDMVVKDGCNKCAGKGKVRPFACHYPFSVENVAEFAKFARASGGFRIS